jgi:hypothetical protein
VKMKSWSEKILAFVLGAMTMSVLSFIATSNAQNPFVKLVMRFGEVRVLEDGTKVGVSKGDGDLIIVTLSRPASNQPSGGFNLDDVKPASRPVTKKSSDLQLSTYKIVAAETSVTDDVLNGFQQSVTIRIKIENIDQSGNVTAGISRFGSKGLLKGTINADGKLQLDGIIVANTGEQKVSLTATVEGKTLTNGKYLVVYTDTIKVRGAFNLAFVEDED